jgi:Domain of unknown function (DUF4340)
MNKKTTLILLGALLALIGGYFAFVHKWHGLDNEFHITDAKAVGKIEIEKIELTVPKDKITLETKTGDAWMVNGLYTASDSKIADFLKTLMEIRVLQPIEPKGQGPALSLLKRNHIRVHIWDRAGNEMKDYLIGATNSTQTANIFKMNFSDKCYLVSKPALQGYVSIYYSTELLDWREKLLWNIAGADLTEIAVTYVPDSLHESFVLQKAGFDWTIDGVKAEQNRVNGYLELFQGKVFAESFADANFPGILDSLSHKRTPEARLRLATQDQKTMELSLFARPENVNDFFAYLAPGQELLTVQHFVIDKYLKRRSFFVNQN